METNDLTPERVEVTPEKAGYWLQHCNSNNRRKSPPLVNKYATDMTNGAWCTECHQGIAFDINGILIDGQHRLAAVVLSGKTISMWVSFGLNPIVRQYTDGGRGRTTAEIWEMEGMFPLLGSKTFLQGLANRVMAGYSTNPKALTRSQYEAFIAPHHEAFLFAIDRFRSIPGKVTGIRIAAVVAPIVRAYYTAPPMPD